MTTARAVQVITTELGLLKDERNTPVRTKPRTEKWT